MLEINSGGNMNTRELSRKKLFYISLIIVSILLLLLGFYHISVQRNYIENGYKTVAIVENVLKYPDASSETYEEEIKHYEDLLDYYKAQGIIDKYAGTAIIISYEFKGKEYICDLEYFSSDISIAQTLIIYLSEDDPTDFIYEKENKFGLYFCMIVGTCLLIGGVAFFLIENHNIKVDQQLIKDGKVIQAIVLFADEDEKKSSFGKHPFIFTCSYKDPETNDEKIFTSESIYCKNSGLSYVGKQVKIYVDPKDFNNYCVDVKQFEKE